MKRYDAIKKIAEQLDDELVISNIGIPSKELHQIRDNPNNFYMLGSMSMATPIGIGLALALEDNDDTRKVVVLDGDGSVLMNLAEFVTIKAHPPKNLIVVIIDNQAYGSTGSQKTYTTQVNLTKIIQAIGIKEAHYIDARKTTEHIHLEDYLDKTGPIILHIKVNPGNTDAPNITYTPHQIKDTFMKQVQ